MSEDPVGDPPIFHLYNTKNSALLRFQKRSPKYCDSRSLFGNLVELGNILGNRSPFLAMPFRACSVLWERRPGTNPARIDCPICISSLAGIVPASVPGQTNGP